MGHIKRLLDEPSCFLDNDKVCASCFKDQGIKKYIKKHTDGNSCNFCNKTGTKGLSFSNLMDFIHKRISQRYSDRNEACVPYESAEGGYLIEGLDSTDLLAELKLYVENYKVQEKIENYLYDMNGGDNWIENNWNMPDDPNINHDLAFNWKYFCNYVKYRKRFFFNNTPSARILSKLKNLIKNHNLIQKIKVGSVFYRARAFKKDYPTPEYSIKTLGPPKPEDIKDRSGRMNPAGIPIFYCSNSKTTAYREISNPNKKGYVLVGAFTLKKEMYIIDFTKLSKLVIPSYFDENTSLEARDELIFFKSFQNEISKPIEKDGREHTDYVPTQIITEFLKDLKLKNKNKIMGIGYNSRIDSGKNFALFFRRDTYRDIIIPSSFIQLDINSIEKI